MRNLPPALEAIVNRVRHVKPDLRAARLMINCMDLTAMPRNAGPALINQLARDSELGMFGRVASVCVDIFQLSRMYNAVARNRIAVGTVINYPNGRGSIEHTKQETRQAVIRGASEIEIAVDIEALLAGDKDQARDILSACKAICDRDAIMKVTLNVDRFQDYAQVYEAATLAIDAGANMLVTAAPPRNLSHATPDMLPAAAAILQAIKDNGRPVGFKAGGIEDTARGAAPYVALARQMMGDHWVTPRNFRVGGRSLHKDAAVLLQSGYNNPRP